MSDSLLHLIINKSRTVKYREKKKKTFCREEGIVEDVQKMKGKRTGQFKKKGT